MSYRERLLPRWWAWIVAGGLVLMLGVAYGAALGALAGWLVGGAGALLACWLLWITSPTIVVDDRGLSAGGATLPWASVGPARALEPAELVAMLRQDARVFTAVRPWSTAAGVVVEVVDADDPHPAWVLSSRSPGRLVDALDARTPDRAH